MKVQKILASQIFFWPAKNIFGRADGMGIWQAKLFLASQNLILAGPKNFGRADGIAISGFLSNSKRHLKLGLAGYSLGSPKSASR